MKYFWKAITPVLGAWVILYVVLCLSYLTVNITQMAIVHLIEFRTICAVISVIGVIVYYHIYRDGDPTRPTSGNTRTQAGGSTLSQQTLDTIHAEVKEDRQLLILKRVTNGDTQFVIHFVRRD